MLNNPGHLNIDASRQPYSNCINRSIDLPAKTATSVLVPNPNRAYAAFINNGSTDVTLILGETNTSEINKGIILRAGGSYEITQINLYVGRVSVISESRSFLSIVECSL